jgi:hypothetical protein
VYVKIDRGKNRRIQQKIIYYLLHNATSFDPKMGPSSGTVHELEK